MIVEGKEYRTVWMEGGTVCMIDQTQLPHTFSIIRADRWQETADAIRTMLVRGAGALAAAGAYGMVQVFQTARNRADIDDGYQHLRQTRPTAQNLFYSLDRVKQAGLSVTQVEKQAAAALQMADQLSDDDSQMASRIGDHGNPLITSGMKILTHCNAGWLAFVDWGTAIAPIYKAHRQGKSVMVWVDETRPLLQGARLTAWELAQFGVPHRIIPDNAAAYYMASGQVDMVITGADRIAANGDTANKIGTLDRAILAHYYQIPFYIAAPTTTIDWNTPSGQAIPIEQRSPDEVHTISGLAPDGKITRIRITPASSPASNPAFDVTPAGLIHGFITEKGIYRPDQLHQLNPQSNG
ncbi:MAG: S-methyl-5-thioribose-1-phosphate isomerase [Candidatus Delongbacteria bacterium]|nr:S-methyl-5-thioribose-1-phosphate isomerase [Candidatus Delongbacteria bacterium]